MAAGDCFCSSSEGFVPFLKDGCFLVALLWRFQEELLGPGSCKLRLDTAVRHTTHCDEVCMMALLISMIAPLGSGFALVILGKCDGLGTALS